MQGLRKSLAIGAVCAALGAAVSGGVAAVAQDSGHDDTFYACAPAGAWVRPASIRVNRTPKCGPGQTVVSWSEQGPPGPAGPPGPPGESDGLREIRIDLGPNGLQGVDPCGDGLFHSFPEGCAASRSGAYALTIDGANYPAGATARVEWNLFSSIGSLCARLLDVTAGVPEPASEACITQPTWVSGGSLSRFQSVTSDEWTLAPGPVEYDLEALKEPVPAAPSDYGLVVTARLIVRW